MVISRLAECPPDGPGTVPVRFGVLGPLAVWCGSRRIRVPAAKQRAVLAVLLAHADRPVSLDRLVDELWVDTAPCTARKTVQGYVWRLRRTLGAFSSRLATVDSGYQLIVARGALDSHEFESLVAAARAAATASRHEEAVGLLSRALRLWRGPAFACVPRVPSVEACALRLDEARLTAQELLITSKLVLGHHRETVPELIGLTALHPARESLHRLLMTALYHAGRRQDALDVFARLRRSLADDYGLDPHRETAALHQAVLRDAVDLAP